MMTDQLYTEIPVVFEDVRFHRATNIHPEGMYSSTFFHSPSLAPVHTGC